MSGRLANVWMGVITVLWLLPLVAVLRLGLGSRPILAVTTVVAALALGAVPLLRQFAACLQSARANLGSTACPA
ncbi:MAG TPA: hypothetical protein VFA60_09520 [Terriglobales bacterium]|nr:hypothetical protein [Terriglobales bacterium]